MAVHQTSTAGEEPRLAAADDDDDLDDDDDDDDGLEGYELALTARSRRPSSMPPGYAR